MRLGLPGRSLGSVSSEGSSSAGQNYLHETTHNVTVIENEYPVLTLDKTSHWVAHNYGRVSRY